MSEYPHAKKLDVTKDVEKFKEIKDRMAMQVFTNFQFILMLFLVNCFTA